MWKIKFVAFTLFVLLILVLALQSLPANAAGGIGRNATPAATPVQPGGGDGSTTSVEVIVEEPVWTPPIGPVCQTAWWCYTNNRGQRACLTLNTNDPNQSTNSARWTPTLPYSGDYEVFAYIPAHDAFVWPCTGQYIEWDTTDAHYQIHYGGGNTTVSRNQAPVFNDWISLGTYSFNAGSSGYVVLTDLNDEANFSHFVSFSAMRFVLRSSSIAGRVTDSAGYPIADVTISDGAGHSARTNANGDYTIGGLNPGTYTVTPSKAGHSFSPSSHSVAVPPSATGKDFTATNRYALSGRVTDGQGNGMANVPVGCYGLTWSRVVNTAADGRYSCGDLVAGFYILKAPPGSPYRLTPSAHGWYFVPPNRTGKDFTTRPVYGTLTGRVTAQGGQAISGARVSAGGRVGNTDGAGHYAVNNIPPGTYYVYITANGYQDYRGQATIQAGGTTTHNAVLTLIRPDGYRLPYPGGITYKCTQGNGGPYSHFGLYYYAFDWGMNVGSDVVAIRDGRVIAVKEDSTVGGCNPAYANYANYVAVQHADSTVSVYVHLQAWSVPVVVGDYVKSGQVIGRSGQTGYSCGAHLHIHRHPYNSSWSIATSFLDVATNGGVPQGGYWYTSGNYRQLLGDPAPEPGPLSDTEPPVGSVRFRMTGLPTYTVHLQAFDYGANQIQVRLAASAEDLPGAAWQPLAEYMDWTQPGVWVQFKDDAGNASAVYSDTIEAVVYEPIQADFAISPTACVGTDPSIVNLTTPFCEQCGWTWEMGDGRRSLDAYPFFPFPSDGYTRTGIFTITLGATNITTTSSFSRRVEILPAPTAEFTLTRSGAVITVEAREANATSWSWDFGDGTMATGRVAMHMYTDTTRVYPVQLNVTGGNGCSTVGYRYVTPIVKVFLPLLIK